MSSPSPPDSVRQQLLAKLWDLGRQMSTQTVFLHQAIAQTIGLNATDTKCVDLILRAPDGKLTAGQLSEMSGLTTGAVTHILDRLEKKGFVERQRDPSDRRKVLVSVTMESLESVGPRYEEMGRAYMSITDRYDDEALRVICDYMEQTGRISEQQLAKLVAAGRGKGKR
jgi:DNA-binding MarR family transcriptional regulator